MTGWRVSWQRLSSGFSSGLWLDNSNILKCCDSQDSSEALDLAMAAAHLPRTLASQFNNKGLSTHSKFNCIVFVKWKVLQPFSKIGFLDCIHSMLNSNIETSNSLIVNSLGWARVCYCWQPCNDSEGTVGVDTTFRILVGLRGGEADVRFSNISITICPLISLMKLWLPKKDNLSSSK